MSPESIELAIELAQEKQDELWTWFTRDGEILYGNTTMIERAKILGVPYDVACMADLKIDALRQLIRELEELSKEGKE